MEATEKFSKMLIAEMADLGMTEFTEENARAALNSINDRMRALLNDSRQRSQICSAISTSVWINAQTQRAVSQFLYQAEAAK